MEDGLQLSVKLAVTDSEDISPETIFREHSRLVMRICTDILKNQDYADDAFQSTFLKVTQNIDYFRENPEMLKGKLVNAAKTAALDIFRKQQLIMRHELPILTDEELKSVNTFIGVSADKLVDEYFETKVLGWIERNEILLAVDALKDRYKQIIKEFYIEGYKIPEIAEIHGAKEDTVKQWLHRARKKLKKEIRRRLNNEKMR
ncbi:MAG: sigma-70 family RNA polymerase sigma factor [Lachnospiraceae bacterium]|nr:sigma-70 family RNA polymerase sigma factor [Lachnospiraceae bacterium]